MHNPILSCVSSGVRQMTVPIATTVGELRTMLASQLRLPAHQFVHLVKQRQFLDDDTKTVGSLNLSSMTTIGVCHASVHKFACKVTVHLVGDGFAQGKSELALDLSSTSLVKVIAEACLPDLNRNRATKIKSHQITVMLNGKLVEHGSQLGDLTLNGRQANFCAEVDLYDRVHVAMWDLQSVPVPSACEADLKSRYASVGPMGTLYVAFVPCKTTGLPTDHAESEDTREEFFTDRLEWRPSVEQTPGGQSIFLSSLMAFVYNKDGPKQGRRAQMVGFMRWYDDGWVVKGESVSSVSVVPTSRCVVFQRPQVRAYVYENESSQ
jgi:hypothetical protein